jgi:hypothetical protein
MKQLRILTSNSEVVVVLLAMALLFNVAAASAQSYSVLYELGKHTVPQPNPKYFGLMIEGWDANGNTTQGGAVRFNFSLQLTSCDWKVVSEYAWSSRLFSIAPIGGHTVFQSADWDSFSHSSSGADGECCPPSDPTAGNLDLPRHPRCDRSPTRDFLSPSARLTVLLPHQFAVDRLVGETSIRRICWR